ncbi:MBL fold metallo-hydrolase [Acidianus sulfidivorans JP7]|uniref:MBL fold metallo-hydrolase n=1 Tax=Acidianus sulfidivorans JP7 TaxID=619593 RepID=A0A2U9IL72_9CREN|nr:MBL fold metallo-hydrolase [Acidianus sulfidivorans]AWR96760.1 MBL fold metallo-hydrolase [Acidianus sulfidivorans JP7]
MNQIKNLKITVLSDNFTSTIIPPLIGEWGFSAYIEADGIKILYDVGNSGLPVLYNSEKLNINLRDIDYLILSHGHSDHTGGLGNKELLEKLKGKTLIAHPNIIEKKFLNWNNKLQYIGLPISKEELETNFNVIFTKKPLEFSSGIIFSGEIKRYENPELNSGLYRGGEEGVETDHLFDDAALFINTTKGLVILTGCGHSNVLNIINYAKEVTNIRNVYAVLGGFHLLSSDPKYVNEVIGKLSSESSKIGPSHCSGNLAKSLVSKDQFVDFGVGKIFQI